MSVDTEWISKFRAMLSEWLLADLVFIVRCYVSTPYRVLTSDLRWNDTPLIVSSTIYDSLTESWLLVVRKEELDYSSAIVVWKNSSLEWLAGHLSEKEYVDGPVDKARFNDIKRVTRFRDDILCVDSNTVRIIRNGVVRSLITLDTEPVFQQPSSICSSLKRVYVLDSGIVYSIEWSNNDYNQLHRRFSLLGFLGFHTSHGWSLVWASPDDTTLCLENDQDTDWLITVSNPPDPATTKQWAVDLDQTTMLNSRTCVGISFKGELRIRTHKGLSTELDATNKYGQLDRIAFDPAHHRLLVARRLATSTTQLLLIDHFSF